jgi:hypothetical protein
MFNFRHVIMRVGIPSCNRNNWDIGKALQRHMANKHGVEPARLLTEKTNPNPSVTAPHCIAHYDIKYFDEACAIVRDIWKGRESQGDLFDDL